MDLEKRLADLKAKRRAVEDAIAALQRVKAEYRDKHERERLLLNGRIISSHRLARPSQRIA